MIRTYSILFFILALMGCNSGPEEKERKTDGKKGGLLIMNQFQGFSTLHPPATYESSSAQLGTHILETLLGYDPESLEFSGLLAEDWSINTESTEFTFTIRKEVYFHDDPCFPGGKGRLMTPDDIIFCLKQLCKKSALNQNSWLLTEHVKGAKEFYQKGKSVMTDEIEGIQVVDGDKIKITLERSNVEFLHLLTHFGTSIYPKEALDSYKKNVGDHPIGTGPFRLKTMRMDEICILERHNSYWGVDAEGNRLPYLEGVKVGFVKNGSELSNSMRKGLLHLVMDADIVEGGERITALLDEMPNKYTQSSEYELETIYLAFKNDTGIFSDQRIRKAFSFAIDKNLITENVLSNSARPGQFGMVPLGFRSYPYNKVKGPSFDVEAAKVLLTEAGYTDGVGFPAITLQIQNRFKDVAVAQEIQRQLKENLDLSISITAVPRSQHYERTEEGSAVLWIDNWIADYRAPENFLTTLCSINTPEAGDSYLNTPRYVNAAYDSICSSSKRINDVKERNESYARADYKLVNEDAGIVPIYYETSMIISHTAVQNLSPPMFGKFDLRRVYILD